MSYTSPRQTELTLTREIPASPTGVYDAWLERLGPRSARSAGSMLPTGSSGVYVVTDDPDSVFERATRAKATVVRGLKDEDYGSRGFTVADPEGNLWSFGSYRGS